MTKREFQKQKRREFQELKKAIDTFFTESGDLPKTTPSLELLRADLSVIEKTYKRWWKNA